MPHQSISKLSYNTATDNPNIRKGNYLTACFIAIQFFNPMVGSVKIKSHPVGVRVLPVSDDLKSEKFYISVS